MKKSKILWLIDAGHGGIDSKGVYVTGPAKMFKFPDGFTIYEGVVNRAIAKIVYLQLMQNQIDFALLYDDVIDTSLGSRIRIANTLHAKDSRCVVLSIHSNAGGGAGFEVYTKPGQDTSDPYAEVFMGTYAEKLPQFKSRTDKSDGDLDKEANFAMVGGNIKTPLYCPAVLLENLFMDNRAEAEYLMSPMGQLQIANAIVSAILKIESL